MTRPALLPITFADFPAYEETVSTGVQIAVIGVPYLSPYPLEKSYDSQNAVSTIRQASLTYKKIDFVEVVPERDLANLTSLFAARQLLNFIGVVAHSKLTTNANKKSNRK